MSQEVEYTYTTQFEFPSCVTKHRPFHGSFEVDGLCRYLVDSNGDEEKTLFTLYALARASDPLNHKAYDFSGHASHLQLLYNILQLTIGFHTCHYVRANRDIGLLGPIIEFYRLPKVTHDFIERAESSGINISKWKGHQQWTSSASIMGPLTPDLVKIIAQYVSQVHTDRSRCKFRALEDYFRGNLDRVNPYNHWYKIFETASDSKLGFFNRADKLLDIGGRAIDIEFLRRYANLHRHSEHSPDGKKTLIWIKRTRPEWQELIDNPAKARAKYDKLIRVVLEHYVLNC